ncbi:MAG: hypothetical protein OXI87_21330 [Albidovulum sp.]|nr:hypothetical protein [Albidovulum sp.]
MKNVMRRQSSMPGLLRLACGEFERIPDRVDSRGLALGDCLASGLAVFLLKFPSLLQFDTEARRVRNPAVAHNLRALFGVARPPSDTAMRERLDRVDHRKLRGCFNKALAQLQRGKVLEQFTLFDGHVLLSLDGTQYFSSNKVRCAACCRKRHRNGATSYYHQMLAGALVHPDLEVVFPVAPEMIEKEDGASKNDCEQNAARRFVEGYRREHPHLKTVVLQDGLASKGPHIKLLRSRDLRYILGAKPGDHKFLFEWAKDHPEARTLKKTERAKKGRIAHEFRWLDDAPLNETRSDVRVNLLEYAEVRPDGSKTGWSWAADLPLDEATVFHVMRAARSRWRIENETFNTLKNHGYEFEHNFGHGEKNLSSVFATLCLLAFLIDQIQEHCCALFKKAKRYQERKLYLWRELRYCFGKVKMQDWETLWHILATPGLSIEAESILDKSALDSC